MGSLAESSHLDRDIYVKVRICYKCFSYDHLSNTYSHPQRCTRCGEIHKVADSKENQDARLGKNSWPEKIKELKEVKTLQDDKTISDGVRRYQGPS